MSRENWTPGPWALDTDGDLEPIAKDSSNGLWGLVPLFDGTNADDPEVRANMKLIANAPDMYKALLAAYHALKSYEYGNVAPDLAKDTAAQAERVLIAVLGTEASL